MCTLNNTALYTPTINLIDGGKHRDQYDEYIEIQVSWGPVLLGRSTVYLITYYTTSENKGQLIFSCSEEVPGSTTTITRVVRDPVPGLTHVFTIRSVVKIRSRVFMSEQVNTSIVFGELLINLMKLFLNFAVACIFIYSIYNYAIFYTDKEYFQIQFGSVEHCITWTVSLISTNN